MSQTLDRALSILDVVAEKPRRINDVAEYLGVHHSTALRLLHTLRSHGWVHERSDHSYRLGSAIFRLAFSALENIDLRSVARPYMEKLNETTGETVHLGSLEDGDVVYIEKVEARHRVRMHSRIGGAATLHATGLSKAILAFLPAKKQDELISSHTLTRYTEHTLTTVAALKADLARTRERGYATNEQEHELGLHGIAAPIRGGDGAVVGAISLVTPLSRIDREALEGLVPLVLETSRGVSHELGWRGE
jgi:DNA-binding IclR family transcriptional regulator